MGKLFVISGSSGVGKGTVIKELLARNPEFKLSVSCTTRKPREGEVHGKNYFFLSMEEFLKKSLNGEMLEATEFRDWLYGTSLDGVKQDTINVGVFNPAGIVNLMKNKDVQLFVVKVQASNKVRLLRSLHREINPDVDEIVRRYLADKKDFEGFESVYEPDYVFDSEGVGAQALIDTANEIVLLAQRYWAEQEN